MICIIILHAGSWRDCDKSGLLSRATTAADAR